ncbi:hypothetical protein ABS642_00885 [Microbacterium sp. A8/3-1]|uniref:Uncharacterized protein n=1 Tax=Microbacterium sp. A8/3-1 TaxID=3160749 RepID=A0AAU7VYS4_9MICO
MLTNATYEKGDEVLVTEKDYGYHVRGGGAHYYAPGDELLVTSARSSGYLNVRPAPPADGSVFRIPTAHVRPVPRMIGEVPAGSIPADHPGLEWLWEDAGRMADRLGLCEDYDRLCDALRIPGRLRTFSISLLSADGITVTAKVEARSKSLAEQRVRERLGGGTGTAPLMLEQSRQIGEPA